MAKLTTADQRIAAEYQCAKPKQFGNMHERMKFLQESLMAFKMAFDEAGQPGSLHNHFGRLWDAVFDLEMEVKHHKPATPPFGRRTVRLG